MNFQPLRDFLDFYLPMLGVPGSDTVIYKDRKEVFRYQSGFDSIRYRTPVRDNALYHMYSVTKVATCVAATQLLERGEILLTDPVYAYFPEYKDITVKHLRPDGTYDIRPAKNVMTIKHLLTMTGGLDYNLNRPGILAVKEKTGGRCPTLDIVRALAADPLDFEPGTKYQYSLCLDVVGGLVELVSGISLGQYMRENIFEPLGMYRTSFGMTDEKKAMMNAQYEYDAVNKRAMEIPVTANAFNFGPEYESGGAGLISCVDDQILLADALTHLGLGKNGNRILSRFGVEMMRANHLDKDVLPTMQIDHNPGYGYGFGVRTNITPYTAGNLAPLGEFGWDGARLSYLSADPENRVAVFHAEHMGGLHKIVIPRLRNVIYACLED